MTGLPANFPPFSPPLPLGWTEHQAPGGLSYYYHAASGQSTYVRPLPTVIPGASPKTKKERPRTKTPIPGTAWLRVTTTDGNVFWTHKERKESVWEVPEEIKEQVAAMEVNEREKERETTKKAERDAAEGTERESEEKERAEVEHAREEQEEVQRVVGEVKDAVKRKAQEPAEGNMSNGHKKPRIDDAEADAESLQREMVAEATTETGSGMAEASVADVQEITAAAAPFTVPKRVYLSLDEAKALFRTLLQEKEVNPLHPWDKSLPLFIKDPRYVLLPSVAARRDAFDEYCRETIREQRTAAAAAQRTELDTEQEYARLLREEVTSTRTTWHEFRRRWKKDRRFFGWAGDRERERAFREWVRELGEVKRRAAEKAEREFFQLLREHKEIVPDSVWKEAKRKIDPKDPRYDAVGSSSLREELFGTYVKTLGVGEMPAHVDGKDSSSTTDGTHAAAQRRQRAERAERERAKVVRRERNGLERELGRTRGAVGREEGEREFTMLLTDAVHDPQAVWEATVPILANDPRFVLCALPLATQCSLFDAHTARLQARPRAALHALFAANSPRLSDTWDSLSKDTQRALEDSVPVTQLGIVDVAREFAMWQRTRGTEAREAFNQMLGENAFLDFWGRMGKAGGKELDPVEEGASDGEGEGGGGRADLKKLAKAVDVAEIGKVLQGDARWTAFDHVPEHREQWLHAYMERLAAPKLSVHVPDTNVT